MDSVVIKVKYGDVLRRFNAPIAGFNFVGLRKTIISLFNFAPHVELMLTYVDEDDDVVNLVDDDDVQDVVRQGLDPLRITVEVKSGEDVKQYTSSTESSTPLRSTRVQQPKQNLHDGVIELLRPMPQPLQETLVKLTYLVSRASSSAPVVGELIDVVSKVGMSYLAQNSELHPGVQSSTHGGASQSPSSAETKVSGIRQVDPALTSTTPTFMKSDPPNNNDGSGNLKPEVVMENEVKIPSVTGGRKNGSSFDFTAVAAALESQNTSSATANDSVVSPAQVRLKSPAPVRLKSVAISAQSKKAKLKKAIEMSPLLPVVHKAGKDAGSGDSTSPPKDEVTFDIRSRAALHDGVKIPPGPILGTSTMSECPFSGISVPFEAISSGKDTNLNNSSLIITHHGIICDGCDVNPITGPRFKSKVKVDYDLCSSCFKKMGNNADYIRMDFPMVRPRPVNCMGGPHNGQDNAGGQNLPQVYNEPKMDSCFVEDVNIIDGTVMAPLTPFTKIWRMRNNGTAGWLQGTKLVWIGGCKMSNVLSVDLKIPVDGVWTNQELDVGVHCISPDLPGHYVSYWRMATPFGRVFGQRLWVHIQVDASIKKTPQETIRNLNLNLPPGANNCLDCPEIINVKPEPLVKGSHPDPDNSKKIVELVQPQNEQDLKFPINDNLLIGHPSSSTDPFPASSVSYPVVDLSPVSLIPPPSVPPMPYHPLPSQPKASTASALMESQKGDKKVDLELEAMLLRRLDAMGFTWDDLNRAVLRRNEYDMEQAVEDLCNCDQGTEWDTLLDELKEMGFCDTEKNTVLLKKYNGSIKLVVMDLIGAKMDKMD